MSQVKFISDRISYQNHPDSFSVVVSGKIERWKESALLAWVVAWTACGAFFVYELTTDLPSETKMGIFILLFFWLYFEIRVGRALLWRLFGFEQIRFKEGQFSIKRNIKGYGKRRDYFVENITSFQIVDRATRSIVASMEESFWVVGGERLYFDHLGKKVGLGMQLSEAETKKLQELLNKQLKKFRS